MLHHVKTRFLEVNLLGEIQIRKIPDNLEFFVCLIKTTEKEYLCE